MQQALEKKESLPSPRPPACLLWLRHIRQRPPFKRCQRVLLKKRPGYLFPPPLGHCLIRRPHPHRPRRQVVRVGGKKVNPPPRQPLLHQSLRGRPEAPQQRRRRHLHVTPLMNPAIQPLRFCPNQPIPLRVRNDR